MQMVASLPKPKTAFDCMMHHVRHHLYRGGNSLDRFRPLLNEIEGIIYNHQYDNDYRYKKGRYYN